MRFVNKYWGCEGYRLEAKVPDGGLNVTYPAYKLYAFQQAEQGVNCHPVQEM